MTRKGSYLSKTFKQRACEYYNAEKGLMSDKALCLCEGKDGTVYIGTDLGLNFTKADGSFGAFSCGEVKIIYTAPDGTVFFANDKTLYAVNDKKISEFQTFDTKIRDMSCDDEVYLMTENDLLILKDGEFVRFDFHNETKGECLACRNGKIMASNGRSVSMAQGKRKHWMTVVPEHSTMPEIKINSIEFDETIGFLWLGTDKGAYIFDGKSNWYGHNEINALPEEEIYRVRLAKDGRVIFSSNAGLIILENGSRKYLPAKRWAFEKDINDAIAVDGAIWTATNTGVTKITENEMTLRSKADYCYELIEKYYVREPGFVVGLEGIKNCDIETSKPRITDNDGLWTQCYVGSMCYAYAVTKDEKILESARRSMKAAAYLTKVSGIKGFTARAVRFSCDGTPDDRSKKEWNPSVDGKCIWRGDTSSDEMTGHFFGFSLYYDFCANEEEKEYIREIICDIVDHILDNNYRLCDIDGLPTTWAIWDPAELNRNNMWMWEKCINSLEMLTFLSVAYHVSGNEKYRKEFLHLAIDEHYLLNASQHKKADAHVCHIDDNLGFLCMATILRTEEDPSIRKYLLMGLKHHWDYERTEHRAWFNLIYGAFSDDVCDLDVSAKYLREFPIDFAERPIFNSSRKGLVYDTEQELWGERPQLKEALDIDARVIRTCDSNPFRTDDGREGNATSPATFLLPYWFGRYYGLIEE